jgi:hypothetical protein
MFVKLSGAAVPLAAKRAARFHFAKAEALFRRRLFSAGGSFLTPLHKGKVSLQAVANT